MRFIPISFFKTRESSFVRVPIWIMRLLQQGNEKGAARVMSVMLVEGNVGRFPALQSAFAVVAADCVGDFFVVAGDFGRVEAETSQGELIGGN